MPKHGKTYRAAAEKRDAEKAYALPEALELLKEGKSQKFDETVELHVKTSADPRHADQLLRGHVVLPAGSGKTPRIAALAAEAAEQKAAKDAGADIVGGEEFIQKIEAGELNFDVMVATPALMKSLAKVARVLGPKGLMPSPKSGTVTADIGAAVEMLKKGRLEFRVDKNGIVHSRVGRVSFSAADLEKNVRAFVAALTEARPSGVKGALIRGVSVCRTMGPGVTVETSFVTA